MPTRTLVFLMTAARAGFIATTLMENGYPETLPAAIVENATRPNQRAFYSTLAGLGEVVKTNKVTHPATIIVGNVISVLHKDLYNINDNDNHIINEKEKEALVSTLPPPVQQPQQQFLPGSPILPYNAVAPSAAAAVSQLYPTSVVCPPAVKAVDFTDQHLAFINNKLSGRTPQQILMWCADTLPGLVQVTSFGATGMVILDMMV